MRTESSRTVVVVGGGVAGISAAVRLAEAGRDVVLLEARSRLGGVAASGVRDGRAVDTGTHVMLRCYHQHRRLLTQLGVAEQVPVQDRMSIPVLLPGRPATRLRRSRRGPAPLHLLGALAGYAGLSPTERVAAIRAAAALRRLSPTDPALDTQSFGQWLARHGQDARAVRRLWGLVAVAALNAAPDQASLAQAVMVFRTALLCSVDGADIAVPRVPLRDVHDLPARALLDRLGVATRRRTRVVALDRVGPDQTIRVAVRDTSGGPDTIHAAAVILAVPHQEAASIVPESACPDRGRWAALGASPIVNVHLHLDRRVTRLPFAATPESPVQWFFDRTAGPDGPGAGQYLVTSVSAAEQQLSEPARQLVATHLDALRTLLPEARTVSVRDAWVTREPRATFRQAPGTGALRPPAATAWPGLALAGAWTDTGWPDTLEGAVRSGLTAADVVLARGAGPGASARRRSAIVRQETHTVEVTP